MTKTGQEITLPISDWLRRELALLLEGRAEYEYIFSSRQVKKQGGRKSIDRSQAYRILRSAVKKYGLRRIGTHTLSKTFAYHYYRARDLASCFASTDVAQAWQKLAAKELEGVEMIAEDAFKDVLKQRMKELPDATIRLCGLDPEVWRASREKVQHDEEQVLTSAAAYQSEDEVMDVDVEVLDLFDIFGTKTAETVITEVATAKQKQEIETIQLLTFAELASASGKKKVKRPAKIMENQLLLSFG